MARAARGRTQRRASGAPKPALGRRAAVAIVDAWLQRATSATHRRGVGSTRDAARAGREPWPSCSPRVTVSVIEGTPRQLPGVALGSAVLLHAERALALLAVTVAALSILVQAARGRLPIELSTSGLRYEAEAADDAAAAVVDLQEQLDDLGRLVEALAERLDALAHRP